VVEGHVPAEVQLKLKSSGAELLVGVRVAPSAHRTEIRGLYGDKIKIAVNAPPEDNRANNALMKALSSWLGIPKDSVRLVSGHGSRDKVVAIADVPERQLRERLAAMLDPGEAKKREGLMDREILRQKLMNEKERLLAEVEELDAELADSLRDAAESMYDQHMAETAAITIDREIDLSLEENVRASLVQIERALKKLDNGTYGTCDGCGSPIAEERLESAPFATLCIDCKRIEERKY
jgi:RNA polymerase-binding protein DksA